MFQSLMQQSLMISQVFMVLVKYYLKPAPDGTGVIAGGPVRNVVELSWYSKYSYLNLQGSSTPINIVRATMEGLKSELRTVEQVAEH